MGKKCVFPAWFLFLVLAAGPAVFAQGACGADWTWANPLPQGNGLLGAATDGATMLAVGSHGTVVRFSGSDYTVGNVGQPYLLTSVAFGAGRWVAGGHDPATTTPVILTSEDGVQWVTRLAGGTGSIFGVTRGDSLFVAVGYDGVGDQDLVFTSPDGIGWTFHPTGTREGFRAVAFGGGRFVVVAEYTIFTSTDGVSWFSHPLGPFLEFNAVTYAAGMFVAVGHDASGGALFARSTDGLSWRWAKASPDVELHAVCYGFGQFLAAGWKRFTGGSWAYMSPDGQVWNTLGPIDPYGPVSSGVYCQTRFHLVGEGGLLLWSGDGSTWVKATTGVHRGWSDVALGQGAFVAVGEGGYFSKSLDGETWNALSFSDGLDLWGVAYGNGRFVAVGEGGTVKVSTEGFVWHNGSSGTPKTLRDVATNGNSFVAVGDGGTVLWSETGESWTPLPSPTTHDLSGIAYGPLLYVAVTDRGESFLYGVTGWVEVPTGSPAFLSSVAYGEGRFVAVGEGGRILTLDPPGTTWTERSSGVSDDLLSVAYVDGTFVAVSWSDLRQEALVLTSEDGATWAVHNPGVGHPLQGAGGGRGLLFALGVGGTILKSACPPVLSSLFPSRGSTAGGNVVTLSGTGLRGAETVTFDGLPASFAETGDGRLQALAPAHAAGPVTVLVRNLGGWSGPQTYTYVEPPVITSVAKLTNPFRLVVRGTNFKNPCTVYAGGTAVPVTAYKSATKVVARGSTLKSLFPKGVPVEVTVVNDADGVPSAPYLFSR